VYADVVGYNPLLIQTCDGGSLHKLYSLFTFDDVYDFELRVYYEYGQNYSTRHNTLVAQHLWRNDLHNNATIIIPCASGKAGTLYSYLPNTDSEISNAEFFSFSPEFWDLTTRIWGTVEGSLLSEYGGAAAAYSLRVLSASTTNVVKVRRSGDDAELDFTANEVSGGTLEAWVVAGGGTKDGFVVTWYDQSGNANNATQATAANQPKIVSAGSLVTDNGKAAIDFDGTGDYLEASSSSLASVFNSTFLLCLVSSPTNIDPLSNSGNNKRIIHSFTSSSNTLQLVINESSEDRVDSGAGIVSASNGVFFKLQQTLFVAEMQADKVYIDGIDSGTGTTAAGNPSPIGTGTRIGADKAGSAVNGEYVGSIQEVIVYASDQSANRTGIEGNINDYYNIYP
jgi:hypothetical protein